MLVPKLLATTRCYSATKDWYIPVLPFLPSQWYLFTILSSLSPRPSSRLLAWVSKNLCKIMSALGQLDLMDPMFNEFLRTFCQVSRYMRPQPWPTSFFQCLEDHRAAHPSKVYLGHMVQAWHVRQVYTRYGSFVFHTCERILWCIWLQIVGQLNDKQMHGRGFSWLDHWVQCHREIPEGCAQIKVRSCR